MMLNSSILRWIMFTESCGSISPYKIGDMDDSRRRELYRPARLILDDVAFLVIEPPDVNYLWLKAGPIRIDAGEGQPPQSSSTLPVAPAGIRTTWIYLEELNTFLLFSAGNASLEWTGPEVDRPTLTRSAHFREQVR